MDKINKSPHSYLQSIFYIFKGNRHVNIKLILPIFSAIIWEGLALLISLYFVSIDVYCRLCLASYIVDLTHVKHLKYLKQFLLCISAMCTRDLPTRLCVRRIRRPGCSLCLGHNVLLNLEQGQLAKACAMVVYVKWVIDCTYLPYLYIFVACLDRARVQEGSLSNQLIMSNELMHI